MTATETDQRDADTPIFNDLADAQVAEAAPFDGSAPTADPDTSPDEPNGDDEGDDEDNQDTENTDDEGPPQPA